MKATRFCSVPACGMPVLARGWCSTHYSRWRTTGDVQADTPRLDKSGGKPCSISGCRRDHYGQGLCHLHWQRWYKSGDAGDATELRGKGDDDVLEAQFWRHVLPTGCCWLWMGAKSRGYGIYALRSHPRRHIPAHRFAYESLVGLIPPGLHLDHLCRVHACVNPDHLQPVTPSENVRRANRRKQHTTELTGVVA